MWLFGDSKDKTKSEQPIKNAAQYARMTFTLPKEVAGAIAKIPSQKRSREIAGILSEEFSRRKFSKNLEQFAKEPPFFKI